jgi:hypothetical protein
MSSPYRDAEDIQVPLSRINSLVSVFILLVAAAYQLKAAYLFAKNFKRLNSVVKSYVLGKCT